MTETKDDLSRAIAIIGVGARMPGALSAPAFWENIQSGVDAITEVPAERWDPALYFDPDPNAPDKTYSKIGGWVTGFEFDRKAFRLPPTVVQSTDPTQLLCLEAVREALQDCGYDQRDFDRDRCAVILGNAMGGDLRDRTNLRLQYPEVDQVLRASLLELAAGRLSDAQIDQMAGEVEARVKARLPDISEDSMPGELANVIAGRIAQAFDLRGPNYVCDAACASTLAALEAAVQGLRARAFDMAVTGGADCSMGAPTYVKFSKIGALSPDGSRPFDAAANGFVMGEGAGILVLKRLEDAVRDDDPIYGLIRGVGGSSDGKGKGITAPNPRGQVLAVERAYRDAGFSPRSISLMEAHGTSTPVGDPVEIGSITQVLRGAEGDWACDRIALGSVKSMIGHLKAAAAAASLVKVAFALRDGVLPPTLNVTTPNPALEIEATPFEIQREARPWEISPESPRRAGISAFGFGGTNFHVALEAYEPEGRANLGRDTEGKSFVVSAPSSSASMRSQRDDVSTTKDRRSEILDVMLAVLCDKTGYDPDEIEVDFELEADLGVDTVKQAEIMAAVREHFALAKDDEFRLAQHPTLAALADYVVERLGDDAPEGESVDPTTQAGPGPLARTEDEGDDDGILAFTGADIAELRDRFEAFAADFAARGLPAALPHRLDLEAGACALPDSELRLAVAYTSADELADRLPRAQRALERNKGWKVLSNQGIHFAERRTDGAVAMLFPGQGTQYLGMLDGLRGRFDAVDRTLGEADAIMEPILGRPLSELIYPDLSEGSANNEARAFLALSQTEVTQPAVLAADVALYELLGDLGIAPEMVAGHSLGEYGACVAAGVMSFADALRTVAARGTEMSKATPMHGDPGLMAGVPLSADEVDRVLAEIDGYVVCANKNCPGQTIIAGLTEPVREAVARFEAEGHSVVMLPVSHAFHSEVVAAASEPLRRHLAGIEIDAPRLPILTNVTGDFYPDGPDAIRDLLAAQVAAPVEFIELVERMYARGARIFVEVGPKRAQSSFVGSILEGREHVALYTNHPKKGDLGALYDALAQLWSIGAWRAEQEAKDVTTSTPPADANAADRAAILEVMLQVLCEKTGYDPDEIEVDFELEADLGVDTVKQAEIMAAVRESFSLAKDDEFRLAQYPTLAALADYVVERLGGASDADRQPTLRQQDEPPATPVSADQRPALRQEEPAPRDEGGDYEPVRHEIPAEVVVSGASMGLPGLDELFADDAIDQLLRGENLIGQIPLEQRQGIVSRRVTRLVKHADGGGEMQEVVDPDEALNLAGRGGRFDLSDWGIPERLQGSMDRTSQMAIAAGLLALKDAGLPLVPRYRDTTTGKKVTIGWTLPESVGDETGVIFASAFAGDDALAQEVEAASRQGYAFDHRFLLRVLGMAHARFAEMVGARGPATRINNACASTTTAMAMAEDWIRLGRCKRVVILAADDATGESLMEWVGAGFLATGAATTERDVTKAALPFDRRRNGIILGMGAVAMVVEAAGLPEARGVEPIADLLATRLANSAMHPTRLDPDHIAGQVDALVGEVEERFALRREAIAERTVFVSHETYSPARGGSARTEIDSLRRTFGERADEVVIANTKGFTGHAMGAGIEDVVALKALQREQLPHIANFQEPDPELGSLRLSEGGDYELDYALRLAAGFGSQLALALLRYRARTEHRIFDAARYEAWLREVSGFTTTALSVEQRTLRLRAGKPKTTAPSPVEAGEPAEPTSPAAPARAEVLDVMLQVLCEKTGYDPGEIEFGYELEADLGVDTVKQAEIMAAVRESFSLPKDDAFRLAEHPTLDALADYVLERLGAESSPADEPIEAPAAEPAPAPVARPKLREPRSSFTPRAVIVEAHAAATFDLAALEAQLRGRHVVVLAGPILVAELMHRAARRCGSKVTVIGDASHRSPLDAHQICDLSDEAATRREFDRLGRVDGVINLLGFGLDGFDADDVYEAARLTFHAARAWAAHLGGAPGAEHFFLSVTGMGGRLGFDRATGPLPVGGAVTGLTKALAREWDEARVRVVDVAREGFYPDLGLQILAQAMDDEPGLEVGLIGGVRYAPTLVELDELAPIAATSGAPAPDDVLVVTGGAKGITAEVCVDLARRYGVRLALVGRTALTHDDPLGVDLDAEKARIRAELAARGERVTPVKVSDALWPLLSQQEIARNIARMREAGATEVAYFSADVADAESVQATVDAVVARFGRVDGVIHGAGVEESKLLADKDLRGFDRVFRGKAMGALHLWSAVEPHSPRLFVNFGSVAGRFGNPGQVDYSAANEVLNKLTALINHTCEVHAVTIDWTAWDEVGMAAEGSMKALLEQRGVELLPPDIGARRVGDILDSGIAGEFLVAGELGDFGEAPHIARAGAGSARPMPLIGRVVEQSEGRAEVERVVTLDYDHFLGDHVYEGNPVFPGVMGYELMVETAQLAAGPAAAVVAVEEVRFERAIKMHRGEPLRLVCTAEADGDALVTTVSSIREGATGRTLRQTHFTARVRLGPERRATALPAPLALDPEQRYLQGPGKVEIYKHFFHTGLFEVLEEVPYVGADAVVGYGRVPTGRLSDGMDSRAFGTDPMVREMAFQTAGLWGMYHRHTSYLPLGIGRAELFATAEPGARVCIRARLRDDAPEHGLAFDVEVRDEAGHLLQRMEKVELIGHRPLTEEERFAPFPTRQWTGLRLSGPEATALLADRGLSFAAVLTDEERQAHDRLLSARRRGEWIAARIASKSLVTRYLRDLHGLAIGLEGVVIDKDENRAPRARLRGEAARIAKDIALPHLSITHSSGVAWAGIAATGAARRIGIDLEQIDERDDAFARNYFTPTELALRPEGPRGPLDGPTRLSVMWSLKEAVSKALGLGLLLRLDEVEILGFGPTAEGLSATVSLRGEAARAFDDLGGRALAVEVKIDGHVVLSVARFEVGAASVHDVPAKPGDDAPPPLRPHQLAAVAALLEHKGFARAAKRNPSRREVQRRADRPMSAAQSRDDLPTWKS